MPLLSFRISQPNSGKSFFCCLLIIRVFDIVQRAITQNVTYSEKAKEVQNIANTEKVTLVVWMSQ